MGKSTGARGVTASISPTVDVAAVTPSSGPAPQKKKKLGSPCALKVLLLVSWMIVVWPWEEGRCPARTPKKCFLRSEINYPKYCLLQYLG